jgi:hypothetical protein
MSIPKPVVRRAVLLIPALIGILYVFGCDRPGTEGHAVVATVAQSGDAPIRTAFLNRQSDLWVESQGTVERILPDDVKGSRHQRFIVRLQSGQTLLMAHNIDIAPRIDDLRTGDIISFRGEYEWNDKGGLVHWTHRDPGGRLPGGWIERRGVRYR